LVFVTLTHVNIRDGNLPLPLGMRLALEGAIKADLDAIAVTIWLLALTLAVVSKYGNTLFG
ncbi:MAG TPA: hypothetical protein VFC19_47515, partial [Candidatus Limnocylindrales bacterium]|nr:hypothetical protein [Candidatus Limnocylindrales bacterium]HZM83423.1 hypothetical protein [Candidatus Limnocylindrales bacterium]